MKKVKYLVLPFVALGALAVAFAFTTNNTSTPEEDVTIHENMNNQRINLFVTHGHCSTPFSGAVQNLKITAPLREDKGNPLENLQLSFDIDPDSFVACRSEDLTERVKTPGLFSGEKGEKITFRSTNVYTMGIDWYQVNGKMSIKGIERDVKFFVTGIRDPKESMATVLVLEGQMNLLDWGIDYDKIVTGKSDPVPTKWMHMNMTVEI